MNKRLVIGISILVVLVAVLLLYNLDFSPDRVYCEEEQRNVEACTFDYNPVCGSDLETHGNACSACSDPEVEYYVLGECEE